MADDEPAEPTAAAKVFAIPELLEHIILLLADTSISTSISTSTSGGAFDMKLHKLQEIQPLASISAICRVSRDFHATITSSKKIQRRMWKPLVSRVPQKKLRFHLPGDIFFNVDPPLKTAQDVRIPIGNLHDLASSKYYESAHIAAPEASWRRIKLLSSDYSFRIEPIWEGWWQCGPERWQATCPFRWVRENDLTIGQLYDLCVKVVPEYGEQPSMLWEQVQKHLRKTGGHLARTLDDIYY